MDAAALLAFATAVVILTAGLTATAGYALQSNRRDRLLLWFGLFAAIYGVRMVFKQPLASSLGIGRAGAAWAESSLSYVILVPAFLFGHVLYGPGWRRSFTWICSGVAAYAIVAIALDLVTGDPGSAPDPSNVALLAVLLSVVVGARAGYAPPPFPEWRVLLAGIVTFLLFVVNEHLVNAGAVPWRVSAEPAGFVGQLGCFGYIAVSRFFSQDRRLSAIDQEMRSARDIQASILPRALPAVTGVRVAARYLPLAAVAGDIYDVVAIADGGLAVLVADVSGHGVPAALIASMVKVAFTSVLAESHDPGAILTRMNTTLCGLFSQSYVTAACAVVQPAARLIRYALAGHPPPLLLQGSGIAVTELNERGMVLGFFDSATYATASVSLDDHARLVIYTDGVTETPGAGDDQFGTGRLSALMLGERGTAPPTFADRVVDAIHRFAVPAGFGDGGAMAHDDVTLLVVDVEAV